MPNNMFLILLLVDRDKTMSWVLSPNSAKNMIMKDNNNVDIKFINQTSFLEK